MLIAIPVTENKLESKISSSFGRAEYFFIYNINNKDSYFLNNSAVASQGGAGIKAAQALVDAQVDVLLTPRCGENAASVLHEAKIMIYKSIGNDIKDNIIAFDQAKLEILNEIHTGLHNHGGR